MAGHEVIALGHLLAEGNLCHPHSVYFYSQDTEQVDDYIRSGGTIRQRHLLDRPCIKKPSRSMPNELTDPVEPGIVDWAKELGIWGKGAVEKTIPDEAFALSNRQLGLLISRMWEGDGHINSKDRSLFYATSSKRMARQMQHIFLRFGIISRLRTVNFPYKEGRIGYQLFVTGNDNLVAFNEHVGVHFVSDERRSTMAALCLDAIQSQRHKRCGSGGRQVAGPQREGAGWRHMDSS